MANKRKSMHQINEIFRRKSNGESSRSIARNTGFSRTTINDYLRIIGAQGFDLMQALSMSEEALLKLIGDARETASLTKSSRKTSIEDNLSIWLQELKKTGVTRSLLWQEYRNENPTGYGYSQFCYHLDQHKNIQQATMHFSHEPGDCLMVDYAGKLLSYVDATTGEIVECQVLVCTFPYSGYSHVVAMHSQQQEDFVSGLNKALFFFGGTPRNIKMDNLKSGVKKANRYDPDFTDLINSFSSWFKTNCTTSRVAKPKDKASVENAVVTAYRRIYAPLRNRTFFSLSELNAAILDQLQLHHKIRFQNKPFTREELFLEERETLAPLPEKPFEKYCATKAKVQKNYHVQLGQDKHFYSVPYQHIGKTLKVVYTLDTVEIYEGLTRIAFHQRIGKSYGYTTLKEHMPPNHAFYREQRGWDSDYFKRQSIKIGPQTHEFVCTLLLSKDFIEQTYNACLGVLRLEKKYSSQRLESACERALISPNISYRVLEGILRRGMDKVPIPTETQLQINIPDHENIRGKQAYE
jgi:transposase